MNTVSNNKTYNTFDTTNYAANYDSSTRKLMKGKTIQISVQKKNITSWNDGVFERCRKVEGATEAEVLANALATIKFDIAGKQGYKVVAFTHKISADDVSKIIDSRPVYVAKMDVAKGFCF